VGGRCAENMEERDILSVELYEKDVDGMVDVIAEAEDVEE